MADEKPHKWTRGGVCCLTALGAMETEKALPGAKYGTLWRGLIAHIYLQIDWL